MKENEQPQKLTKAEAIQALKEGKKLTHRYFYSHEWIRQEGFTMIMEDGASIDTDTFWKEREGIGFENDWSIVEQPQQTQGKLSADELIDKYLGKDLLSDYHRYQTVLAMTEYTEQLNKPELEVQQIQALLDKGYQMAMNEVNSRPQVLSDEDIEKLALLQYPMNLNIINDDENEKLRIGFIRGFKASQSLTPKP